MSGPAPLALPPALDWTPFAQQIVEDARLALGTPYVILARFDLVARRSHPMFFAGLYRPEVRRAEQLMERLVPWYRHKDPVVSLDANWVMQAMADRGETVMAPLEEAARNAAPALITKIVSRVAGLRHVLAVPLIVEDRVLGSLSCYQRSPLFTPAQVLTAQAFCRQVALSIHNAALLEQARAGAAALDAAHRLIAQAEDRTRRDISEFLHSRVQSRLLVVETRLVELAGAHPAARERLLSIRTQVQDLAERDVRQISHRLHPEALRLGVLPALQILAEDLRGTLEVQIITDDTFVDFDAQPECPPQTLRLTAFRLIEESIGNALKHSRASLVTVVLSVTASALRLEVVDDGQGFDVQTLVPGLGVLCMGARVDASRGRWSLDSRPGGPTRVWAELPR